MPLKTVWELRDLLAEPKVEKEVEEESKKRELPVSLSPEGLVIDMRSDPPPTFLWVLLILAVIVYLLYKIGGLGV